MKYIAQKVRQFLEFKALNEQNYDPLSSPALMTITIDGAKEIDAYYGEAVAIKNEEIRQLKETIVEMAKLIKNS